MQGKLILLRKERNIKQQELADLLHISLKQYGFKENGKSVFNGDEMFAISNYFNLPIEDIFLPRIHQIGEKE